ncbi:hypothetical protein Purlil1_12124 [Purpureocillium lilacinum]|uniref:Uncharacterized protein n=1 Tax=Purpureocillium lilacinum TaxID=33203 RepID=A0ABR0BHN0_PURLI|nr:hypothetical protein Purlil1_12124 [Purpureocillium lilacinum]
MRAVVPESFMPLLTSAIRDTIHRPRAKVDQAYAATLEQAPSIGTDQLHYQSTPSSSHPLLLRKPFWSNKFAWSDPRMQSTTVSEPALQTVTSFPLLPNTRSSEE